MCATHTLYIQLSWVIGIFLDMTLANPEASKDSVPHFNIKHYIRSALIHPMCIRDTVAQKLCIGLL